MQTKRVGVVLTVFGVATGLWVYSRLTSLVGQSHTWEPPFGSYEMTTFIGGLIAAGLLILGLFDLVKKGPSA
jgi:hypothetical protein